MFTLTSKRFAHLRWSRTLRVVLVASVLCWLPGSVAAQSETVEYYAMDAIGSVRVVFDGSGNVTGRMDYAPFGEELYTGLFLPSERFAELTRDGESGQDYARARMYQVRTGRFSVPDPVFAGAFNPQLWNRYTYGVNNPVRFTDPSGLCPEEPCLQMPWHEVVHGRYDLAGGAAGGTGRGSSEDELVGFLDEELGGLPFVEVAPIENGEQTVTPTTDELDDCQNVPIKPKEADIDANVRLTRWMKASAEATTVFPTAAKLKWFKGQVQNKGPWDYEQLNKRDGKNYEPFGNMHYGIVGAAMGFSKELLLRAAGLAQSASGNAGQGYWFGPKAPYGDDPPDARWILRGTAYYHQKYEQKPCKK